MAFGLLSSTSPAIKWLGFVTAIWVQAVAGNNYTFSNYSDALKSLMALSQLQLNNLSVAKDVGKAFGILAGLASDRLPTSVILIIGAVEGLIGYGVQWLVVSEKIHPLPYWQMCVFLCMGGNSTTWMNTAVLVTCIRNFMNNQGPVSGILKGYVGLSTAIFTDLSTALFSANNPSAFLLTLAITPAIICLTAALFLREMPTASTATEEKHQSTIFHFFNIVATIIAIYLLIFDITGSVHTPVVSSMFAAGLLVLLAAPLYIPVYFIFATPVYNSVEEQHNESLLIQNQEKDIIILQDVLELEGKHHPRIGEDHTILEAICTFDFWVLFVSFLCGVGTGMCVLNNLGQMGQALGYLDVSIFISLTSIWGFFGRVVSGMASEHFIRKYATPRPIWNAVSQILMATGFVLMAIAFEGSLYIGSIIVGLCYGVRLAVTVPIASELFGLKYFGLLYNILILNLPLGSFFFSGLLAGYLYDAQATDGRNSCTGPHCYRLVFLIMALACVFGFGLDILLALRTRTLYLKIYEAKMFKKSIAKYTASTSRLQENLCTSHFSHFGDSKFSDYFSVGRIAEIMEAGDTTGDGTAPNASALRWKILSRAFLRCGSSSSDKQSEVGLKRVSRKATYGFNLIPFRVMDGHFEENSEDLYPEKRSGAQRDACFCYTLPTQNASNILLFQRVDSGADLNDFEVCKRYNIDNTGIICQWPSEDVLAYYCLLHADKFRHKRIIELGSGYGLAGLVIAAATEALEVVISDGNPQVVNYIQRSIDANFGAFSASKVKPMVLHWHNEGAVDFENSFDIIVASDCTFFKEFHRDLAQTIRFLLSRKSSSEAILLSPKRGDSLDKFLLEIKDSGLQFNITEIYDSEVWNRHKKFATGDDSWPNYEKDHCYPLLIKITW